MSIIYIKLLSLLLCSSLGYIAAKHLEISGKSIATLIIYIISPIFNFYVMANSTFALKTIWLIPLYSFLCISSSMIILVLSKISLKDSRANVLALGVSTPNLGFFGVPIVISVFSSSFLPVYFLLCIGVAFSVYTFGYFTISRSTYSIKESLKNIRTLPVLYATLFGISFRILNIRIPESLIPTFNFFEGAYSLLGLMMIGIAFASIKSFKIDIPFILLATLGKFLIFPLLTAILIYLDSNTYKFIDPEFTIFLILSSVMPMGINTINLTSILDKNVSEAATAVIYTTIISTILIPIVLLYFG